MRKRGILTMGYAACISCCLLLSFVACKQRPKEILDEKEMVSLMVDMQLAEAYSNSRTTHEGEDDRYSLARSVMAAHGISQEQLDTTLGWYGKNLDEYVELFAKVDKEILKRKKRLMKDEGVTISSDGMNLWPYSANGIVTQLSLTDGWIISVPDPELEKGDRIIWSMHLSEHNDLVASLGVEYTDGSGETTNMNRGRNDHFEITLQTDSAKKVSRLYGSIRIKDRGSLPLFTDSIKLERLPFDSLEYNASRSQKRYAKPVAIIKESKKELKDSVKNGEEKALNVAETTNDKETTPSGESEGTNTSTSGNSGKSLKLEKRGREALQPVTDKGEVKFVPKKVMTGV
ncbi:MAG: DUF4296 domain-containing protein [Muribaculaceae bacterium]|nr:DUF4296 domain-containing protein [Muribaculaceae bacterium]